MTRLSEDRDYLSDDDSDDIIVEQSIKKTMSVQIDNPVKKSIEDTMTMDEMRKIATEYINKLRGNDVHVSNDFTKLMATFLLENQLR